MKKLFIFVVCLVFFGCAANYNFKTLPGSFSNEYLTVTFEPDQCWGIGCKFFTLLIENKSGKNIELNWNKTLYIKDGQTAGGFLFEGVFFRDKNEQKQPDIIFPNSIFKKEIRPSILTNYNSYTHEWYNSSISVGHHGIFLTFIIDGEEVSTTIMSDIKYSKQQE